MYLSPPLTGGSPYCLDPESEALRGSLKNLRIEDGGGLSREALAADLSFFAELLAKVYSGHAELTQRYDLAVDAFFAEWAENVRAGAGTIGFEEGFVAGFIRLARFHRDRHLAPIGGDAALHERPELRVSEFLGPAPPSDVDLGNCRVSESPTSESPLAYQVLPWTLRRAQRAVARGGRDTCPSGSAKEGGGRTTGCGSALEPVVAVSTVGVAPESLRLECASSEHALLRRSDPVSRDADGDGPAYSAKVVGDTTIIRVRRFWGDEADLERLEQLPAEYGLHRGSRRIVFDVRGNGGGDDSTLFKWILQATADPWSQGVSVDFRAGLGACGEWNALVVEHLLSGEVDSAERVSQRKVAREAMQGAVGQGEVLEVDSGLHQSEAEHPFDGPVFVLVDRSTASSGESVPQYLSLALGAHIIGERSAGFVDFGNVVPFVLPRTGLWVQVPTTRFFNESPQEMVGVEVDTYLDGELIGEPAEALLPVIDRIEARLPAKGEAAAEPQL